MAIKYFSLKNILSKDAIYNIIFGERSNGKTYACLKYILEDYVKHKKQGAIVRRWLEDFRGKRAANMFNALIANNEISKITNYEWTDVIYYSSRWYLSKTDENGDLIKDTEPFAFAFALSNMEHDKSTSYPNINTIVFDEFLTRDSYQVDEFVTFMNLISTIVRQRDDVKIFMLGNTVNQYCPYFTEMGLKHISKMKQGDIDVYTYGDSKLKVAVEYADISNKKGKPSDIYFAFDNPKLQMITGGAWEMAMYPHRPVKYAPKDILFTYFIKFDIHILQCEIVSLDNNLFTFIHRKTTSIKDEDRDLIYCDNYDARPNWRMNIKKPMDKIDKKVYWFYANNKVFYQDNEIGEIVRNYLNNCAKF